MRLTRPTLVTPPIITCDMRDIPRRIFNQDLEQNVITVNGSETLQVGQFLLLPQSFGNIYLGETFSCYICVHNCTNELVTGVHLKVTVLHAINISLQNFNVLCFRPTCKLLVRAYIYCLHRIKSFQVP